MRHGNFLTAFFAFALLSCSTGAHAVTLRITSQALERTLHQQLFKAASGRYNLRGRAESGCSIYAEDPKVSFRDDRVVVHVKTHAKLGTAMHGACMGLDLDVEADVTLIPEAQGETIGFRDPRVENLSESRELNVLLEPFLSRKLPHEMNVNAAEVLRATLANSAQTTGYDLKLSSLNIHSMQVQNGALVVVVDGDLDVQ